MTAVPHRIRQQRWTVKAGSTGEAFALRRQLRDAWSEALLPVFERAFDEATNGARTIHLAKLEVSLRLPPSNHLGEDLPRLVFEQLREQLQAALKNQPPAADHERLVAVQASAVAFADLLPYLRAGHLPWPAMRESSQDLTAALRDTCRHERARVLEHLRTHDEPADFHFRLLQLLSEAAAREFLDAAAQRIHPAVRTCVSQVISGLLAGSPARLPRYTQLRLLAAMLGASTTAPRPAQPTSLAWIPATMLAETEQAAFQQILRSLPVSAAGLFPMPAQAEATGPTVSNLAIADAAGQPGAESRPGNVQMLASNSHGPAPAPQPIEPPIGQTPRARDVAAAEFAMLVHSAGLVLLHPYLVRFFTAIGLRVSNEAQLEPPPGLDISHPADWSAGMMPAFRGPMSKADTMSALQSVGSSCEVQNIRASDPLRSSGRASAQTSPRTNPSGLTSTAPSNAPTAEWTPRQTARAAAALHFLATGREDLFEHELGFIKVLLGRRPEQPLLVAEGLLDSETKSEAGALLQSVIRHWSALKHTSVAGLRGTFLNRPGLLRATASGWNLRLERRPFDVLLDQRPWTLSVAKLPWMPLPLFTEW